MEEEQLELLKELVNIGAGRASQALNYMLNSHIDLEAPVVRWMPNADVTQIFEDISEWGLTDLSLIKMRIIGELTGNAQLVFSDQDAAKLVAAMYGDSHQAVDENLNREALNEIGNILINGLIGSLGNMLGISLAYRIPTYRKGKIGNLILVEQDTPVIFSMIRFVIESLNVRGNFILTFEIESAKFLKEILNRYMKSMMEKRNYSA